MKYFLTIVLLIKASFFSYATDDIIVLFSDTIIFDNAIIFSVDVENKSNQNIYILLDYKLQKIECHENAKAVFATLSGEPSPLTYVIENELYYPAHLSMPNFNCVFPRQRQKFHIIIRNYTHNLGKNMQIMYTKIYGMKYFISKPPYYNSWGKSVGYYYYKLYSYFYKKNARSLNP